MKALKNTLFFIFIGSLLHIVLMWFLKNIHFDLNIFSVSILSLLHSITIISIISCCFCFILLMTLIIYEKIKYENNIS